jgi:hypothetical protein
LIDPIYLVLSQTGIWGDCGILIILFIDVTSRLIEVLNDMQENQQRSER